MSERDQLYLKDIQQAIEKINRYVAGITFEQFCKDDKTIDAVVRNFSIIGEAAGKVSQKTQEKYSNVPWREMKAMRNKVIHEYFGVDEEILWQTIIKDIPRLKKALS